MYSDFVLIALGLNKTFHNWFCVSLLHVWMLMVRFRLDGKEGQKNSEALFEHFWKDSELRMIGTGVSSSFCYKSHLNLRLPIQLS